MALFKAHCSIPVVFISGVDPIKLGVAESIPHPGGNYTGVVNISDELTGKRLEFLRDVLPGACRVVCFTDPAFGLAGTAVFLKQTLADANRLGFEFTSIDVASAEQLPQAFDKAAEQKADALLVVPEPLLFSNRQKIIALASQYKLPAIYNFRIEAAEGGLIAYGADVEAQFRTVAIYVDKILRGEKPGNLPIDQATKPALVINLKTARALGLTVPPILLTEADEVIE
jgi:putative ABC transport system substrate-binding protein